MSVKENVTKNGIQFKDTNGKPTMVNLLALDYLDLKALELVAQGFKNGNIRKNEKDDNKFIFTTINNQVNMPKAINKITNLMIENKEYICTNVNEVIDYDCIIGEIIIAGLIVEYLKVENNFDNLMILLNDEEKLLGLRQLILDRTIKQ